MQPDYAGQVNEIELAEHVDELAGQAGKRPLFVVLDPSLMTPTEAEIANDELKRRGSDNRMFVGTVTPHSVKLTGTSETIRLADICNFDHTFTFTAKGHLGSGWDGE